MPESNIDSKGKKCPGGYWIAAGKKCRGSSRTGRSIARVALAGGIIGAGAIGAVGAAKGTEAGLKETGKAVSAADREKAKDDARRRKAAIRGDGGGVGFHSDAIRKGKKCGKGFIPKAFKCGGRKGSSSTGLAAKVATGLVGGIATGAAFHLILDRQADRARSGGGSGTRLPTKYQELVFKRGQKMQGFSINGIPLKSAPVDSYLGKPDNPKIKEAALPKGTKTPKVGVVVVEPDGRLWMMEPLNHVGGRNNFAKGGAEEGLSLQQNALKEAREELGLDISIVDKIGDFDDKTGHRYKEGEEAGVDGRSNRTVRYYVGVRNGGAPWDAHWEADKVRLVTPDVAAKRFREGRDRREASVLKSLSDYTKDEKNRKGLVESYQDSERVSRRQNGWKAMMTPGEAARWAKKGAIKKDLYHLTNSDAAEKITQTGFRTDIIWRANFGIGVYAGQRKKDIAGYARAAPGSNKPRKGSELLTMRTSVEKPLFLNKAMESAGIGTSSTTLGDRQMRLISKYLGMESDFDFYMKKHRELRRSLEARRRTGTLSEAEARYMGLNTPASAQAFTTVVQRAGYDSIFYRKGENRDRHAVIFDPRDITVINRGKVTEADLRGDSSLPETPLLYLDALAKGKRCGKGFIPKARRCMKSLGQGGSPPRARASVPDPSRPALELAPSTAVGMIAGGAAFGAYLAYKEYGTMAFGRMQAGEAWTQKNPPGEPRTNANGVVEFPELKGFDMFTKIAKEETKDDTVYPFASGLMGLVYKSKKDDSFVLKVPKEFKGRQQSVVQAEREWKNLVAAKRTGLTPKPLDFYRGSNSIKMENLMDAKRPGGIPRMLDKSYETADPDSIVEGFTRLHATGVSHGDASASNLMIQDKGKLLFVDLGNKELGDPEGTADDIKQVYKHLAVIEKKTGKQATPSPYLSAIEAYRNTGANPSSYALYREQLRSLHPDIT